jgi:hypothetical protein
VAQLENTKDSNLLILRNFMNNKYENKKDSSTVSEMSKLFAKTGWK